MATGDLITRAIQIETRGLLMGDGTQFALPEDGLFQGFGVLPARADTVPRPRAHGSRPIRQYMGDRILTWTMHLAGDDTDDALDLAIAIGGAWQPLTDGSLAELAFRLGSRIFVVYGQPGRTTLDLTAIDDDIPDTTVQWACTDPRLYGFEVLGAVTPLIVTTGGLGFPHGFPHGFGSAFGVIETAHPGNVPTEWTATIVAADGTPLVNPSLTLASTGERLEIDLELSGSDFLAIDSREGSVLLNGTADRSNAIARPTGDTFFEIPNTADGVVFGGSGNGLCFLNWRAAYLF